MSSIALSWFICLTEEACYCRYSPGKAGTPRLRSDLSHAYGMHSYSWSPLSRHTNAVPPQHRSTPTKCCSSFGSQQPQRVIDVGVSKPEQERGVEEEVDKGCTKQAADQLEKDPVMVSEQEQDVGYVDIPRRVAWERLSSPGRKRRALQVSISKLQARVPATQPSIWYSGHVCCKLFLPKSRMQCQLYGTLQSALLQSRQGLILYPACMPCFICVHLQLEQF